MVLKFASTHVFFYLRGSKVYPHQRFVHLRLFTHMEAKIASSDFFYLRVITLAETLMLSCTEVIDAMEVNDGSQGMNKLADPCWYTVLPKWVYPEHQNVDQIIHAV